MKTFPFPFLIAAFFVGIVRAQEPAPGAPPQLTPEQQRAAAMRLPILDRSALTVEERKRKKVLVEDTERNPFGMVSKVADRTTSAEPVSEQKRIERVLRAMRVAGLGGSVAGPRVMLGSLSLGVGEELPPLFFGQVERLVVKSISDREVLLVFVEPEDSRKERTVGLSFNLRPQVGSMLVGEAFTKMVPLDKDGTPVLPPLQREAAQKSLEAAEAQDFQGMVERPVELFNAPAASAPDEKK